ncbi:hypothetical protein [Streptomyces paludis]|uniref:hypothetical protein n=1 Tax=Streptomyces paludis TaxID=2282738 RepID=UPI0015F2CBFF|nr:hypothetical protein [Streptomyces paludis]
MSTDFLLREQFVTGPTEVLSEYVYGTRVEPEQASVSNQLLYSVVANRDLRSWLHGYALRQSGDVPSGEEFVKEFSDAVVKYGGKDVVLALVRASAPERSVAVLDEDLMHFIFNLGALGDIGAGDIMLTGTSDGTGTVTAGTGDGGTGTGTGTGTGDGGTGTGTGTGTGDGGTGTGTGTGTGDGGTGTGTGTGTGDGGTGTGTGTGTGDGGTGTGTGTGTGDGGTGTGTGTGTGDGGTGTGTLTAITWSTFITQTGTGTGTGTDPFTRSPFTHTDPGTGHAGTGERFGQFGPSYVMVTLDAIAQYATSLQEAGALGRHQ